MRPQFSDTLSKGRKRKEGRERGRKEKERKEMEEQMDKFISHWKTIEKHPGLRLFSSVGDFLSRAGLAASGSSTRRSQEGSLTTLQGES